MKMRNHPTAAFLAFCNTAHSSRFAFQIIRISFFQKQGRCGGSWWESNESAVEGLWQRARRVGIPRSPRAVSIESGLVTPPCLYTCKILSQFCHLSELYFASLKKCGNPIFLRGSRGGVEVTLGRFRCKARHTDAQERTAALLSLDSVCRGGWINDS